MDLVGTFALREKSEYVIFGDGIFADPSNKLLPIRSSNNDSHSMNAEDLSFGFVKGFFFSFMRVGMETKNHVQQLSNAGTMSSCIIEKFLLELKREWNEQSITAEASFKWEETILKELK